MYTFIILNISLINRYFNMKNKINRLGYIILIINIDINKLLRYKKKGCANFHILGNSCDGSAARK